MNKTTLRFCATSVLLTVLVGLDAQPARACDCGGMSVEELVARNAVAIGVYIVKSTESKGIVTHSAWVRRSWKGCLLQGQLIRIVTEANGDACGYGALAPGHYLVSGGADGFNVHIDSCVSVVISTAGASSQELGLFKDACPTKHCCVAAMDKDGDLVSDADDNCPLTPNSDQSDADGNGVGDACDAEVGDIESADDCSPLDPTRFPGAPELCNGKDDNCNGLTDEGYADTDGDGIADCVDADDD